VVSKVVQEKRAYALASLPTLVGIAFMSLTALARDAVLLIGVKAYNLPHPGVHHTYYRQTKYTKNAYWSA
jgi:hypothetical protein